MSQRLGDGLNSLSTPEHNSLVQAENTAILDLHNAIELTGHDTNLFGITHGLTDAGETLGLGRIGGDNLLTDAAQAPGTILNCGSPLTQAATLVQDAGEVVSAGGTLVQGAGHDLSNPSLVCDVLDGLGQHTPAIDNSGDGIGHTIANASLLAQGNLLAALVSTPAHDTSDGYSCCSPSTGTHDALIDVHTDGGALVQIHDEPNSLLGLNSHTVL